MERKCLRCGAEMVEDCKAEISGSFWRIGTITKKSAAAPCKCAVCPKCGYTELYVTKPEAFRSFLKKE